MNDYISATEPEWSREHKRWRDWNPSKSLLSAHRSYERHRSGRGPLSFLARNFAVMRHRFWSVVCGADIPLGTELGGGLLMPHPNGIVIHHDAKVGPNCLIFQQVTIGANSHGRVPTIGGHVDIGAGAKIIGGVTIGDHARIGANAVVVSDVLDYTTVAAIPGTQIVDRRRQPTE